MSDCYWFTEGRCTLDHFPEYLVFDILARVPDARRGLLICANAGSGSGCSNISQDYIDFASRDATLVKDLFEINKIHMDQVNQYNDRTDDANRQKVQLPVLPPGDGDT